MQENQNPAEERDVPFIVHETDMARLERTHNEAMTNMGNANHNMLIALIVAVLVVAISNFVWLGCWIHREHTIERQMMEQGVTVEDTNDARYP